MGPSPNKYCIALTTREKLPHAAMLSSDWSISWFTLLSLVNTGPCKHFLPFVNRKCHTLAPPPTVTTHHPQTLGNDDNWGLAKQNDAGQILSVPSWWMADRMPQHWLHYCINNNSPRAWLSDWIEHWHGYKQKYAGAVWWIIFAKCIPYSCS